MDKLSNVLKFQERQNIVLQNFDPISAGGFTQVPNFLLKDPKMSANAKVVYSMLLSYAWNNDKGFPGRNGWPKKSVRPGRARAVAGPGHAPAALCLPGLLGGRGG